MLGRILAEWDDRPAGCLFLVPLWHPVLMAEQIETLAAMASGTFIVQTGLGGGSDQFRGKGGVPQSTMELVHLRASQVNGCSACVAGGALSAKKAGEL
jgi:AhpD family alkylhydroperoxidase